MTHAQADSASSRTGLEPLGDPDDETGDFADEHQQFVVDGDEEPQDGETESPDRYAGGLEKDGPP